MARVLIPSDDAAFVTHLAKAYERAGYEVVVGTQNFFLRAARFDLVHYLWPEEFSGWKPPTESALAKIREALDWWSQNAETVFTVNNLYPHGYEGDARCQKLYEMFYERSLAIVHHSEASRALVAQHFPVATRKLNAVATGCSYFDLVRAGVNRRQLREELGIAEGDFIILVFGALRMWAEVELLMQAYRQTPVRRKRLLVLARYGEHLPLGMWRRRYRQWRWQLWLKQTGARRITEYVPDAELYRYFESADVVVVPRIKDLSSGLPGLSMTFGKTVVAPNHGAFPEYLAGTDNILYQSGDAASLAAGIAKAATLDRDQVSEKNRQVASLWTWDGIVRTCVAAVVKARDEKKGTS